MTNIQTNAEITFNVNLEKILQRGTILNLKQKINKLNINFYSIKYKENSQDLGLYKSM